MPRRHSASQSQTQTQRANGRRRREVEDEEDEESDDEEVNGDEEEATQTQGGGHIEGLRKKASALVKMALFSEYSRRPIKRAEVTALILNGQSRQFPLVLREAQSILREKFGMELRELRGKYKVDAAGVVNGEASGSQAISAGTLKRKQKGRELNDIDEEDEDQSDQDGVEEEAMPVAKLQKKQANTGNYILRNILPEELLASMSKPRPLPGFNAAGQQAAPSDDEEDSGALLQWEKAEGSNGHIGLLGIRSLIMILILGSGRSLSDDDLHAYLKRLKIYRDTPLNYISADSRDAPLTLDKYLDLLARQNYLEKIKSTRAVGAEGQKIEWRWGSREVEFPEEAAAKWAQAVMIDSQEDIFDDEPTQATQGRGRANGEERNTAENARKRLRKDLEKAAGSSLRGDD